jgi:hypothetical protein
MSEKVEVYSWGLCHASACAPDNLDGEAVAEAVNAKLPTGIESRWQISDDETFKTGCPNPCLCDQDTSRKHWLLVC